MAESIGIDSARLVLPHALLFESGKASLGFFGVVDCVIDLDSESALDSVRLDSKPFLDSVFSLHSALGLPSWHSKD